MVTQQNIVPIQISFQTTTKNTSFMNMHYFLKMKGIENNAFFLALYDTDLMNVDPRDPRLNTFWKAKILKECKFNYWYFLREVIRIPESGSEVGGGSFYRLDRGNLALNFGFTLNWNMFLELPRQFGKTTSALCWYLWIFNFGTTNSDIMFMNKKHEDSKANLRHLREIRSALPSYLQMDSLYGADGKKLRPTSNVETMTHPINNNKISTKPGANSKSKANGIGRGCTMAMQWYDEFAFILYNKIIYMSATPAFSTASKSAKKNGKPYGILITTTPGDLSTEEGEYANSIRNNATPFNERYYDYTRPGQLEELFALNTKSSFMYIRFTYQQLGADETYLERMIKDLQSDWASIRREVLLEWANISDNSPFTQQDLDIVESLLKQPISQIQLGPTASSYFMNIYKQADIVRYPPIIGVDVSGGFSQDSSAITIIDSKTTETLADFNCNYISPIDLAKLIYQLVTQYMPNAIVNIERNGGYGASVIGYLIKTSIKRNLYFEIKDRVTEERFNGMRMAKKTQKVKVYGFDETRDSRNLLMEILRDRMLNHKAKFISKILYNELCTLEVKKGGRIEHADKFHDDQVFSYLLALYVWYEGKNLMENFGLQLREIKTDSETEEIMDADLEGSYTNISRDMERTTAQDTVVKQQLEYLERNKSISYTEWLERQEQENINAVNELLRTHQGRQAWAKEYHQDPEDLEQQGNVMFTMPSSVFSNDLSDEEKVMSAAARLQRQFKNITNIR